MRTISLKRQAIEVDAPRDLVFEVVASAGKKIRDVDGGKVVEFETRWRHRSIKTVEEVRLDPPREIRYRWLEGPIQHVDERIVFSPEGPGKTKMTYTGHIGSGRGFIGWVRSYMFVRPVFDRLVREHLKEGKRTAERRADRSRVHPGPARQR
ncbi:MAG TPA: SRPBCC family protein [Actinomycetota bacterium]|nr:SRPBCC family protein [Actinomycetota bacterium]